VEKSHKIALTLQKDGKQMVWNQNDLPRNLPVQLSSNATFMVNVVEAGGQLKIEVTEAKSAWNIFGN